MLDFVGVSNVFSNRYWSRKI